MKKLNIVMYDFKCSYFGLGNQKAWVHQEGLAHLAQIMEWIAINRKAQGSHQAI